MLALPIVFQNLINFGIMAADNLMLGRLGELQLSAVSVANQLTFVFIILSFSLSAGCGVLTAQFWGAGNDEKVREIVGFMYRLVAILTVIFASLAFFFPTHILSIITTDQEVIAEAVIYLRILSLGYLFSGFTNATIGILRSVGTVKISVLVYCVSLLIGVTLNVGLIFGNFGLPALGVMGAAIATVIARFSELVVFVVYIFKFEKKICFNLRYLFKTGDGVVKGFMKHASPVLVNEVFWSASHFLLGVVIGRMGREFVAANAISALLIQFVGIVIFGVANATSTIIGNTIGEGDQDRAKRYANGMIVLSAGLGILSFGLIQAVRIPFINFYELSELAQNLARQMTHIISVMVIFTSVCVTGMMGTLRGGGDTRFVMVIDSVFPWLISIPLGALAGFVFGWPVAIVFSILRSEDVFKTIMVLWRIPRGKWMRDVTH